MITKQHFGKTSTNKEVFLYIISYKKMQVSISTFGAAIVSIIIPDKKDSPCDVVLGYDDVSGYEKQDTYIGSAIGRCCNRIKNAVFTLSRHKYKLTANEKPNHLHGGRNGFDKKLWSAAITGDNELNMTYISPAGEEGYPGTLTATITYSLSTDYSLIIRYETSSDKDTICNLTNHSYFNLAGYASGSILDQEIQIFADTFTEDGPDFLPTGNVFSVINTPLDLQTPKLIGEGIKSNYAQIKNAHGYNTNYFTTKKSTGLAHIARAHSDKSGITMDTYTTLPCFEFYSGNYLDGNVAGKNNAPIRNYYGFCIEPQFVPNAINSKIFFKPILLKNTTFTSYTLFKFSHESLVK